MQDTTFFTYRAPKLRNDLPSDNTDFSILSMFQTLCLSSWFIPHDPDGCIGPHVNDASCSVWRQSVVSLLILLARYSKCIFRRSYIPLSQTIDVGLRFYYISYSGILQTSTLYNNFILVIKITSCGAKAQQTLPRVAHRGIARFLGIDQKM